MEVRQYQKWVSEIRSKTPVFLDKQLKGSKIPGYYKYSLKGDLYGEDDNWGLANSVFALKIMRILEIKPSNLNDIKQFVLGFQGQDGYFFDPIVKEKTRLTRSLAALRYLDISKLSYEPIKWAETRQAISALKLFNIQSKYQLQDIPGSKEEIEKYLEKQDWQKPWAAGSHFSHLLFFLASSDRSTKEELIKFAIDWTNKRQHRDGSWYEGKPSLQQKINGAMKVITGIRAAEYFLDMDLNVIKRSESLVDLCFKAVNSEHACDNFNVIYVLKHAEQQLDDQYRRDEVLEFTMNRLDIYRKHYHAEFGGFSFYPDKANTNYYGAKITRGLDEPDIHGTIMFLWGLSVIGSILKDESGLYEIIT